MLRIATRSLSSSRVGYNRVDSATEKLKETAQRWGNVAQQKVEHATQAGKEKLNDKYPSGGIQEMQQKGQMKQNKATENPAGIQRDDETNPGETLKNDAKKVMENAKHKMEEAKEKGSEAFKQAKEWIDEKIHRK